MSGAAVPYRRARSKRGQGDQLAVEILDAASALIERAGHADAVSIDDVVGKVGCTPPALYRHFKSKHEMFMAVAARQVSGLAGALDSTAGVERGGAALAARGRGYVAWGLAHPDSYRTAFGHRPWEPMSSDVVAGVQAVVDGFADAAQRGIDDGELAGDAATIALAVWAAAHGLTSLLLAEPDRSWPDHDRLVEATIGGVVGGAAKR